MTMAAASAVCAVPGVGALSGCVGEPFERSSPAQMTVSSPATSRAPSALSALSVPIAYAAEPFVGSVRQPAMIKVMKSDAYFSSEPASVWTFTGDKGWASFNGFKFRTMGSQTVALLSGSHGHVAIVPAEPSVKAATTTSDIIWEPPTPRTDNPHAVELIPAGRHVWAGGKRDAPNLFLVAAPGGAGSLNVYDLDASTMWSMPYQGAHGVLWDPQTERLWALGTGNLSSFRLQPYGDGAGRGQVAKYTGTGWGLGDERAELAIMGTGHDLQPDFSSKGTHLLVSTPSSVLRVPKAHPKQAVELMLDPGVPDTSSYTGSRNVKAITRDASGLYVWVRMQAHGFNAYAVYADNAIMIGQAGGSGDGVRLAATLDLPEGDWTYKARLFTSDYA